MAISDTINLYVDTISGLDPTGGIDEKGYYTFFAGGVPSFYGMKLGFLDYMTPLGYYPGTLVGVLVSVSDTAGYLIGGNGMVQTSPSSESGMLGNFTIGTRDDFFLQLNMTNSDPDIITVSAVDKNNDNILSVTIGITLGKP